MATFVEREFMNTNDSVVFDYSNNTVKFHFNPTPLIDTVNIGGNTFTRNHLSINLGETYMSPSHTSSEEFSWSGEVLNNVLSNSDKIGIGFIILSNTPYPNDYTVGLVIEFMPAGGIKTELLNTSILVPANSGGQSIHLDKSIFDGLKLSGAIFRFTVNTPIITSDISYVCCLTFDGDFTINMSREQLPSGIQTISTNSVTIRNYIFQYLKSISVEWGNIVLYNCKSDNNVLDKTIDKIVTLDGFYRGEISVMNPNLTIEINNPYTDYEYAPNYVYIRDFKRYYYINDITMVRKGLWELSCSVDVLMSFKDYILELEGLIGRCNYIAGESEYDMADREITFLPKPIVSINNGEESQLKIPSLSIYNSNLTCYCMTGYVPIDRFTEVLPDSKKRVTNIISPNTPIFSTYKSIQQAFVKLLTATGNDLGAILGTDPSKCISSLRMFPFDIQDLLSNDDMITITKLVLGTQYSGDSGNMTYIFNNKKILLNGGKILVNENAQYPFLNTETFTDFLLFIPFYGYLSIPFERVCGQTLVLTYLVDITSGNAFALLSFYKNGYTIDNYANDYFMKLNVKFSIDIPFLNNSGIEGLNSTLINKLMGAVGGSAQSGVYYQKNIEKLGQSAGLITGVNIASNIISAVGDVIDSTIPKINMEKSNDYGWLNFMDRNETDATFTTIQMHYIYWQKQPAINKSDFSKYKGSIRHQKSFIVKNCKGITQFEIIHCDNLGNATGDEKSQVEQILRTGVILPET